MKEIIYFPRFEAKDSYDSSEYYFINIFLYISKRKSGLFLTYTKQFNYNPKLQAKFPIPSEGK